MWRTYPGVTHIFLFWVSQIEETLWLPEWRLSFSLRPHALLTMACVLWTVLPYDVRPGVDSVIKHTVHDLASQLSLFIEIFLLFEISLFKIKSRFFASIGSHG